MNDTGGADRAIAVLEKKHDKPFFLAYGSFNPHMPWYVPQKYLDMYPLDRIVLPELKEDDLDDLPPLAKAVSDGIGSFADKVIKSGQHKEAVQAYLATTTYVDTQFGRVLDALETSPYKNNTIVVFLSDHGDMMGSHRLLGKNVPFDESIKVPLMIHLPGQTETRRVSTRVNHIDLLPTLLDLLDQPVPEHLQGRSLRPLLIDEPGSHEADDVFVEWQGVNQMITAELGIRRSGVEHLDREDVERDILPDCLADDPGEVRNVAGESCQRDRLRDLADRVRIWQRRTGDTVPVTDPEK